MAIGRVCVSLTSCETRNDDETGCSGSTATARYISRYLAAYQLGHIEHAWCPYFGDGTERIITSEVSKAWPVPDAGLGAVTYVLEILTGIIGGRARWRTMPWLVILFGVMIVPLGAVSIFFIIIQPILIGTWCTLCLVAAAAMLIQIPYSVDEPIATGQFLLERHRKASRSCWHSSEATPWRAAKRTATIWSVAG